MTHNKNPFAPWTDADQEAYMEERARREAAYREEASRLETSAESIQPVEPFEEEDFPETEEDRLLFEKLDREADEQRHWALKNAHRILVRSYGYGVIPVYPLACPMAAEVGQSCACEGRSGDSLCGEFRGQVGDYVLCAKGLETDGETS